MDQSKLQQNVEVPYEQLETQTLRNLVQGYIEKEDGTYYGVQSEIAMDQKIDVIIAQIRSGDAFIQWNTNLESGTIVLKQDLRN